MFACGALFGVSKHIRKHPKEQHASPAAHLHQTDSGPGGPSGLVGYTKKRNTCKVTATRTAKKTAEIPKTRSSRRLESYVVRMQFFQKRL